MHSHAHRYTCTCTNTHTHGEEALVGELGARSVLPPLPSVNLISQNEHLSSHREVKKKHPRDSQQVTTLLETKVIEECAQGFFLWLGELKMESTLCHCSPQTLCHCFCFVDETDIEERPKESEQYGEKKNQGEERVETHGGLWICTQGDAQLRRDQRSLSTDLYRWAMNPGREMR